MTAIVEPLIERAPYIGSLVLIVFMFLRFLRTVFEEFQGTIKDLLQSQESMRASIDSSTSASRELHAYLRAKNGGLKS